MLISFSVDPDALVENSADLSLAVSLHRSVIKEWRNHGVFVHSHENLRDSTFVKSIESLPQELKKLWKTALLHNKRRATSCGWTGHFPSSSISELAAVADEFSLVLLDSVRSIAICGLAEVDSSKVEVSLNNMEICRFHAASDSSNFRTAETISSKPLSPGDACAKEWSLRYSLLLRACDNVVVVDRYILANHIYRRGEKEASGLDRLLLDCISRPSSRQVSLKIFTALQSDAATPSTADLVLVQDFLADLKRYVGGGIRAIDCSIVLDRTFAIHAHARYFRADYRICGIDSGLDAFGGQVANRASVVWRQDAAASKMFVSAEANLLANAFSNVILT